MHATHDVIVIGAGFAGLYMLHKLRSYGYNALILERAPSIGGTWYWLSHIHISEPTRQAQME